MTGGDSAGYSAGYLADFLADDRRCGECAHSAVEHWAAAAASFACTRPGCGCMGWWSADATPEPAYDGEVLPRGWVGPPVVTVCGSMRFWPLILTVAAAETAAGAIVLAPFVVVPPAEQDAELGAAAGRGLKVRLDALHRAKIAMSSSVQVVTDPSGYWGESTRAEIEYALGWGLAVYVREVDPVTGAQTVHGPMSGGWSR